ncbi:MAG: aldo/keto reductase [Tissierellia bacterium]|nr:aldo/keto reductase [Tissierellia bacterium]
MERVRLGNTDIEVSKLCFGSLTMTPAQANLSINEGANLIKYAYAKGINFIDTAEYYDNYQYIKEALKDIDREDYVIATKCYSYTRDMAAASLDKALMELNTDYIDIFMLHEQESIYTLKGHKEAIEYFLEAKQKGKIRAFGISTHYVAGVHGANELDEVEVIHPIVNMEGIGIQDGTISDMLEAVNKSHSLGKGIYGMKPLGGGHLINRYEEAFNFVKKIDYIHSIAVGMQSFEEVDCNVSIMENGSIPESLMYDLRKKNRKLVIADHCVGCGNCVSTCGHNGIQLIDGRAVPNSGCILCSYCAKVCPDFCIKIV